MLEPVDEIAELIKDCIAESGIKLGNWSTIYLTGAVSASTGRPGLSGGRLDKPVRETIKHHQAIQPIYASAMGSWI